MKYIGKTDADAADITGVTAGTLLDGGGTSGDVTLNVDLSELTDGTADVVGSADELVYLDDGTQKRKQINEIKLGQFNNDQSWTANAGDITGVAAGDNLSGGGSSGDVTINLADASASAKGAVELATVAECTVGEDTARAVTPEGLQAVAGAPNSAYHYIHTENKFTNTTADEYYFSLTDVDRDVAAGSENGVGIVAIMPATGILKTAIIHSGSNLSAKSWEWKLKKVPSGTISTSPTLIATVAASAGPAGNTNKNISFVTDPGDGTNTISYESGFNATTMFSAGDRVLFSQESNSDVSGSPKIQLTLIFQLNETTCL